MITIDEKESKSLELDLEDKVSFEGIEIDQSITSLKIKYAEKLTDISALTSLRNLNVLDLSRCYELTDISALASLNNLNELNLSRCEELTDISALASLKKLEYLDLSYCPKIKDIDVLKSLTKTEISFDETEKDEDQLWDEINDEPSAHYEKWENLREHIYGIVRH